MNFEGECEDKYFYTVYLEKLLVFELVSNCGQKTHLSLSADYDVIYSTFR